VHYARLAEGAFSGAGMSRRSALLWGCVALWLARRVPSERDGALVIRALLYLLLVASVLPLVLCGLYGATVADALGRLGGVVVLSILGLIFGVASVAMVAMNPGGMLMLIAFGLAGIAPLLLLVWVSGRDITPAPTFSDTSHA
jgi:hypothetical protein